VPTASSNVGYLGHTGKHLLIAKFSHFDPGADICNADLLIAVLVLSPFPANLDVVI